MWPLEIQRIERVLDKIEAVHASSSLSGGPRCLVTEPLESTSIIKAVFYLPCYPKSSCPSAQPLSSKPRFPTVCSQKE